MLRSHSLPIFLLFAAAFILSFQTLGPSPSSDEEAHLRGAWRLMEKDNTTSEDLQIEMVKILSNGHFMFAFYNSETQQFFSAGGVPYTFKDGKYTETIDFHTIDPGLHGRSLTFDARIEGDKWYHTGEINGGALNEVYERIDDATGSDLIGTWAQEGDINEKGKLKKLARRHKKLKILSASRFQWVEYNSKNGDFIAAGGGSYELDDNIYKETLNFFTLDTTLVGSEITFNIDYTHNRWEHQEQASRGEEPELGVNELWTRSDW